MSTLDVASVLISTMVNWVTCLAYILFITFTAFNEVYYTTSFVCRVLLQCYHFSCSVAFSCSCKFPVVLVMLSVVGYFKISSKQNDLKTLVIHGR